MLAILCLLTFSGRFEEPSVRLHPRELVMPSCIVPGILRAASGTTFFFFFFFRTAAE